MGNRTAVSESWAIFLCSAVTVAILLSFFAPLSILAADPIPFHKNGPKTELRPPAAPSHCCFCEYDTRLADDLDRFKNHCESWLKESRNRNWCGYSGINPDHERKSAPSEKDKDCTEVKFLRTGHANPLHCINVAQSVTRLAKCFPNAKTITFDYSGCEAFKDIEGARELLKEVSSALGQNQTLYVTGSQALACIDREYCSSKYSFVLAQDGIKTEFPDVCGIGTRCPKGSNGKSVFCFRRGMVVKQTCICDRRKVNGCFWKG